MQRLKGSMTRLMGWFIRFGLIQIGWNLGWVQNMITKESFSIFNFSMLNYLGGRKAFKFASFSILLHNTDSPIESKLLAFLQDNKLSFTILINKELSFLIIFETLSRQLNAIYFLDCEGLTFLIIGHYTFLTVRISCLGFDLFSF